MNKCRAARRAGPLSIQVGASRSSDRSSTSHPPKAPSPIAGESTPSSPGSARAAGQPGRPGGGQPPRPPRCAHPRPGPQPGASLPRVPEARGRPEPGGRGSARRSQTYRAGGRRPAAAAAAAAALAAAAAPPGPRAPWRTERSLDAGGSPLRRSPAPGSARAQLHLRRPLAPPGLARPLLPRGAAATPGRERGAVGRGAVPPGPARLQPGEGEGKGREGRGGREGREEGAAGRARTGGGGGAGGRPASDRGRGGLARPRAGVKFPATSWGWDVPQPWVGAR